MWLTPLYRRVIRIGLPAFLACMIAGLWLSDETRRASLQGGVTAMIEKVQTRIFISKSTLVFKVAAILENQPDVGGTERQRRPVVVGEELRLQPDPDQLQPDRAEHVPRPGPLTRIEHRQP